MSKLSSRKLVKDIQNTIDELLEEVKQVETVRTPILRRVMKKKAYQWGREEAKAEGKAEGIAEGKAEGKIEGKVEAARNLLKMGLSIKKLPKRWSFPLRTSKSSKKKNKIPLNSFLIQRALLSKKH